jgi:DNA-binding beta-propeller fold protein YncE
MPFDYFNRFAPSTRRRKEPGHKDKPRRFARDNKFCRPQFEALEARRVFSTFTLGTSSLVEAATTGSDTDLLAGSGAWSATANNSWLHLSAPNQSGTGNATIVFTFDANPSVAARTGTLTLGGNTLSVTQAGTSYVAADPVVALVSTGLSSNFGVAVDAFGNVYTADFLNNTIKEWVAATNTVTTLVSTGLSGPAGVAVDGFGNVFITDGKNNALKEWVAASKTVSTLVSTGLNGPDGLALDTSGNVYFADSNSSTIKEWVKATSTVTNLVSSGLFAPSGVAVDVAGNVYIADTGHNAIKEWVAASKTVSTLASTGLNDPVGVMVDGSGNLYTADYGNNAIKERVEGSSTVKTLVSTGLNGPFGEAVDGLGNVYIADSNNKAIKELARAYVGPTSKTEPATVGSDAIFVLPTTANLAAPFAPTSNQSWLTIGAASGGAVNFSFAANPSFITRAATVTVLGVPVTVTQVGASFVLGTYSVVEPQTAGSDTEIIAAGTAGAPWTATANSSWLHVSGGNASGAGSSLVQFTFDANPFTTARTGTLTFGGNTLSVTQAGTSYVAANPVVALVSTGLSAPEGVAVDAAGNVYMADYNNSAIKEWVAATNTVTTLVSTGLFDPADVAVDGSGNVFITDHKNNAIKEWVAASKTVSTLVSTGLNGPDGLALDASGNVYFADSNSSTIKEWVKATGTVTTLVSSGLFSPSGVAVDVVGNVYIADTGHNAIKEWVAASKTVSTLVSTGLNDPVGVAVDGSGNLYTADYGNNAIKERVAGSNTVSTLVSTGLNGPFGETVDAFGNVYIVDSNNNAIKELARAYVGPTSVTEGIAAGSDALLPVLPTSENLAAPFLPFGNESWITIGATTGGVVKYSFTASATTRTNNITVLGVSVAVTQESLFQINGTTLTVFSNPNNENLQVTFTSATAFTVNLNGTTNNYTTPAVNKVVFAGADSNATAVVTDTFNTLNTATLTPTSMTLKSASYEIDVTRTPTKAVSGLAADTATLTGTTGSNRFYGNYPSAGSSVFLNTNAGTTYSETVNGFGAVNVTSSSSGDTAYLYDSAGSNTFNGYPTYATMAGPAYAYQLNAFPVVLAYQQFGSDTAYLHDAAGGSFDSHQTSSAIYGPGYYSAVNGFQVVQAVMANPNDTAFLYDSSGSNKFERHPASGSTSTYSVFYGAGFYNRVDGSLEVTATAGTGTTDQAYIIDGTNDSRLYSYSTTVTLANTDASTIFNFKVNNFGDVAATETGTSSTEAAYQYDTTGGDRFYGQPTQSSVAGLNYWNVANGFGSVFDYSAGGGNDNAYLYDAKNNGTFYGYTGNSVMQGTGYYYQAVGVRNVFALGAGGNTAILADSGGGATFEAHPTYSVLYTSSTFYIQASNYTTVDATGTGNKGTDGAYLYDSPGSDALFASGDGAQISYGANVANIAAFANVLASSTAGGADTKSIKAVDYNLAVTGNWV